VTGVSGEAFDAVLDAARAGEGWAFERLFEALGRPVAAYLRGAGVEDPDGAANEVFLRAFRGLGAFEGDEVRFRSWVFTIAHHLLIDDRRRRARRATTVPLGAAPEPAAGDDHVAVALGDERVRQLLAGLSPDQREVVLLRVVADLSLEDTALAMGKKVNAVKALQHRAMRALRNQLGPEA
jgi:RNA polymerase sigma factor (sigma-70 family)